MTPWLVRAPDHLGDGLMARPCIQALAKLHPLHVVSPKWGSALYPFEGISHHAPNAAPPSELAILLKPSFGAAWRYRHYPRRIGIAYHHRAWLLSDALPIQREHRIESYNRIARFLGAQPDRIPHFPTHHRPPPFDIVFVVGTASPQTVQYKRFSELVQALTPHKSCLAVGGPGDEAILSTLSKQIPTLPSTSSLQDVANHAAAAQWMIGLDSGLSHLATAARHSAGHSSSKTLILYGSTDPEQTGPRPSTPLLPPPLPCWPCYSKSCRIGTPCLEHPIEDIVSRLL